MLIFPLLWWLGWLLFIGTPSLLNRYRPALVANYGANLNLNQQRRPVVNRHLKDDGDAADAGIMELYHRFNF